MKIAFCGRGQDQAGIEVFREVLPLLGRWLDQEKIVFLRDQGQRLCEHSSSFIGRQVVVAAGVEGDLDLSAPALLDVRMEEGLPQMLVGTVGIVRQMSANGFSDLSHLEIRHYLVVELRSDGVPGGGGVDPGTDVLSHVVRVCQDCGGVRTHRAG